MKTSPKALVALVRVFMAFVVISIGSIGFMHSANADEDPKVEILKRLPLIYRTTLPDDHPAVVRARAALADAYTALALEGEPQIDLWARRIWGWSGYESSFYTDPKGSNDKGAAVGVCQVHQPELYVAGITAAMVRKDRVLGYRVCYRVMKKLIVSCKSVKRGLGAFATDGACHDWIPTLVLARCKSIGDVCE